jgi:hypothetical protein
MTTEQFTIWLQGFFELSEEKKLSEKQVTIIKDHLALVFEKVTPDRSAPAPKGLDVTSTSKRVKINMDSILEKKQIVPEGIAKTPQSHIGFNVKKNTIYC